MLSDAHGVWAWWSELSRPWRIYFSAAIAAGLLYIALGALSMTRLLPPGFGWVAVGLWFAAPIGAGTTAWIDRRIQVNAIIREDLGADRPR